MCRENNIEINGLRDPRGDRMRNRGDVLDLYQKFDRREDV